MFYRKRVNTKTNNKNKTEVKRKKTEVVKKNWANIWVRVKPDESYEKIIFICYVELWYLRATLILSLTHSLSLSPLSPQNDCLYQLCS
jgi:hypothetical protein